ncbi:iron chelate uptake ABC transporter family permease subunit [Yinghuangia sp. ASG 101]|uniref:FecCD family ABC transporter permease n=1 Tax=Yinghuangia sp. ASG 101 TaxID=2896848 RepID=UPI001E311388|nr:iron chelate uptake ABC transporter family permease subunit [Yinghuangia sp. ASG 101]UGQ11400.1 iron chelate uptake ABC transporter family permease subunit [Yinghuangia sp. ASG 101]
MTTTLRPTRVDFGRRTLRWRRLGLRVRFDVRTILVSAALGAAAIAVALLSLVTGDYEMSLGEAIGAIGDPDAGFAYTVVNEFRMPRILAALLFGAALGAGGAIFQSITRNPLASPDIIGMSAGSHTGALVVLTWIGGSFQQVALGSVIGGLGTAALVYVLAYSRGVQGYRMIVAGIAVAAMLTSLNTWLLLRAEHDTAVMASVWNIGTLNGTSWSQVRGSALTIGVLLALAGVMARGMRQLELGDEAARAHGVRVEPVRVALILVAVGLTATVTAVAGPIAFVALAAPQIGIRLARSAGMSLLPAATTGALLLCSADFVAQHVLPEQMPVGIVTVVLGGVFLVWLLIHETRSRA